MALTIYKTANPADEFSSEGTFTNPLQHAFDGITGGVLEVRYYVRNDNVDRWYTDIKVQPVVVSGDDIVSGGPGEFNWKLIAGDTQPLDAQWDLATAGGEIDLPDIGIVTAGDDTTYVPFWLRIEVPRGAAVTSFEGVKLDVTFTENIVVP